nr:MAG TPA: hypothetical protein [Caudoviricetes sp.]
MQKSYLIKSEVSESDTLFEKMRIKYAQNT